MSPTNTVVNQIYSHTQKDMALFNEEKTIKTTKKNAAK
jgi:hypothetical protein